MQGKQYVLGKARTINGTHFESADEALERLQDYGCLHYRTPIICGISDPRYSPEELKRLNEQNAKKYTIDGKASADKFLAALTSNRIFPTKYELREPSLNEIFIEKAGSEV